MKKRKSNEDKELTKNLDKERNGEKKVEKEKEIEKEKAEIAQKSTSIVLGYSSSIGMPHVDYKKVVLHNHKGKLSWLGHAFVAPNIISSLCLSSITLFIHQSHLSIINHNTQESHTPTTT